MKELSPFPHKVEIKDAYSRIRIGDIQDEEFISHLINDRNNISWYHINPLIKKYKHEIVCAWMNYVFGTYEWDFENIEPGILEFDTEYRFWITARHEETITMVALKWN
jgi:hypothetical protein